jgi:glycine cleavage system H protein
MSEYLETMLDKFIFKVATDRLYSTEGLWVKLEGNRVRIGVSDFFQQHNGDVAFAEIKAVGKEVAAGAEVATIETMKVNVELPSPITGKIVEVNPVLTTAPEAINQDPYGTGWLAVIEANDWNVEKTHLLEPQAYLKKMKEDAEREVKS